MRRGWIVRKEGNLEKGEREDTEEDRMENSTKVGRGKCWGYRKNGRGGRGRGCGFHPSYMCV